MSLAAAVVVCLLLMVADTVARAWRLMWLVRGVGRRIGFWDAVITNAFGDAAAVATPARLGGEPARVAGMVRAGVAPEAAVVTISYEILASWPVIIVFALALSWLFAPEWLASAGPAFIAKAVSMWPWLVAVAVVTLAAAVWARRFPRAWLERMGPPMRRVAGAWRRMPPGPLLASVPMTLVNLVTRTAVLPVLAMAFPDPPALGPMFLGSFGLLYSQLVLPTPAGLGGVEFGFFAGAAGQFLQHQALLLILWRLFTVGFGFALGTYFVVRLYGWPALRRLVVGRGGDAVLPRTSA